MCKTIAKTKKKEWEEVYHSEHMVQHRVFWKLLALDEMTIIEFSVLRAGQTWFRKQQLHMEENLDRNNNTCLSPHSIPWQLCGPDHIT